MKFDVILQNNATKEVFVLSGLENTSYNSLYLQFDDVELPKNVKDGEYTYAVLVNERTDVVYKPQNSLLETLIETGEGNVQLKDVEPLVGLLKVLKKNKNKDTTIYYERN